MYTIDECSETKFNSFLIFLKEKWDEINTTTNAFRYKIGNTREKVLDGYFLQLNPDRCSKRRTPDHIEAVCQPFNKDKFNFTKVSPDEIIMSLRDKSVDDVSTVLVNVSPISRYHSLLCPAVNSCLPQIATEQSLKLAIKLMLITQDRAFRIGFNSLCALASVNHLHYHLFVEKQLLPVENTECKHVIGPVFCLSDYPIPAFCFQVRQEDHTLVVAEYVNKLLQYFLRNDVAHNIFMTRGRSLDKGAEEVVRILVWPRKSSAGVKQLGAFNVAVCELSGWFPVYNTDDFERLQTSDLEAELRKWKVDNFEDMCNEIKTLFT